MEKIINIETEEFFNALEKTERHKSFTVIGNLDEAITTINNLKIPDDEISYCISNIECNKELQLYDLYCIREAINKKLSDKTFFCYGVQIDSKILLHNVKIKFVVTY